MKKIKLIIILLLCLMVKLVTAQQDTVIIQFLGKDTITETLEKVKEKVNEEYSCNFDSSKIVKVLNQEYRQDGKYCFRRGMPYDCEGMCPVPNDFEFYVDGKLVKSITNKHYKVMSTVSSDGYVVSISVLEVDKDIIPRIFYLSIYTPYGEEILFKKIEGNFMDKKIRTCISAEYVAVNPVGTSNLIVFNNKGEEVITLNNSDAWGSFSFYENKYLIANGDDFYIVNLENKKIVSIPVNPSTYKIDIDNNQLIVIEENNYYEDFNSDKQSYIYYISLIQFSSGKILTEYKLPNYQPKSVAYSKINIIDNKNFNFTINNIRYEFKIN